MASRCGRRSTRCTRSWPACSTCTRSRTTRRRSMCFRAWRAGPDAGRSRSAMSTWPACSSAKPAVLSTELSGYTQEDCTTYNMLKLTRHIFGWTADPACADFYERALFNGIIGSQHPHDGEKLYYVNLAAGLWKLFGTPGQDYWCCTGTMSESFSQFGDSIYFHDDAGVYVNLDRKSVV